MRSNVNQVADGQRERGTGANTGKMGEWENGCGARVTAPSNDVENLLADTFGAGRLAGSLVNPKIAE